jgi:hypothetical protein
VNGYRAFSLACFIGAAISFGVFLHSCSAATHSLAQAGQAARQGERAIQRAEAGLRQSQAAIAKIETTSARKLGSGCTTANGTPGVWVRGSGSSLYCFTYADTQTVP